MIRGSTIAKRVWAVLLASLVSLWLTAPATQAQSVAWQGQSIDQAFVAGLRERRLHNLADAYCQEQLKRGDLDPTRRTELILELAKTQIAMASQAPADKHEAAWQRADQTVNDFYRQQSSAPKAILILVQHAMIPLARAELTRQEMEFRSTVNETARGPTLRTDSIP